MQSAWSPIESSSLKLFVSPDDSGNHAEYAVEALTSLYKGTSGDTRLAVMVEDLITGGSLQVLSAFEESLNGVDTPVAVEASMGKSLELLLNRFPFLSEEGSSFLKVR